MRLSSAAAAAERERGQAQREQLDRDKGQQHKDHDDLNSDSFFSVIMEAKRQGIAKGVEKRIWGESLS